MHFDQNDRVLAIVFFFYAMPPWAASLRLMMLGNSEVGKSSVLRKSMDEKFSPLHMVSTMGIESKTTIVDIDGQRVRLAIWDTAGQERYIQITVNMLQGIQGIALVYDCTDEESFNNIRNWVSQIRASAPNAEIVLLCNKVDLDKQRCVSAERGQDLAAKYEIPLFETSAVTGKNINLAFQTLAGNVFHKQQLMIKMAPGDVAGTADKKASCGRMRRCFCFTNDRRQM